MIGHKSKANTASLSGPRPKRPKKTAPRPLESDVRKAIVSTLNLLPYVRLWPNNVGAYKAESHFLRYGLAKGSADFIGVVSGRFFALEVKRDSKSKPRTTQIAWLNEVIRFDGFAAVVSSVQEAVQAAYDAKLGKKAKPIPIPPSPAPKPRKATPSPKGNTTKPTKKTSRSPNPGDTCC